jgi:sugar (pentulose or hexulose) kinase
VLAQLRQKTPTRDWVAIGLSGMIPTLVTVDRARNPVGPAITWEDARAEAEGTAMREAVGPDHVYRLTGQWVDGRYLLPMFAWIKQHDPQRAMSTASVCGAKDYLYLYLTGELATDPSTATGYGCYDLASQSWNGDVAQAAGVAPAEVLPEIVESSANSPLRPDLAPELGLPAGLSVYVGAADSVLGASGLGVTEPGQVGYVAGTSTVIIQVSDRIQLDRAHRYLVTPMAEAGRWGFEMDLLSSGSAMQWMAEILNLDDGVPALLELAERSQPGAGGLTFLPYLSLGEQGALWDAGLRGAVFGLTLGHRREDLARALLEGIVIESRRCLGVLDEAGPASREITAAGAGGGSRLFWQLLADATGRTVAIPPAHGTMVSALGAALLAAQSVGAGPSRTAERARGGQVHPNAESAILWEGIGQRHDQHLAMISTPRH